jgi:hypothetical protein
VTEKPSLAQVKEDFEQFLFEMSEMLEALQQLAERAQLGPLDYSYESLDRLEALVAQVLDGKLALPDGANVNQLMTAVARYLGETVKRRIGGTWSFVKSTKSASYGQPAITGLPELPKAYEFLPLAVARGYQRSRRPGWLRDQVELHDLAAQRARVASFDAATPAELKALADELQAGRPDAPPLDFSVESLDALEQLLGQALDDKREPRELRPLCDRIARYMGEVFRKRAGGEWSLVDDPEDGNFGELRVRSFAPLSVVQNFTLRRQQGLLAQATRSVLSRATGGAAGSEA